MSKFGMAALSLVSVTAPVIAQTATLQKALDLGSVLGSEMACSLEIDQNAVKAWIDKNVQTSDMRFAGTLNLTTAGTAAQVKEMSAAQREAHCTQVRRVARANKFIGE